MGQMVALAGQLGLSLENMIALFKDNTTQAQLFRNLLTSLPGGVSQTNEEMQAFFKGWELLKRDMASGPSLLQRLFSPDAFTDTGLGRWMRGKLETYITGPGREQIRGENLIRDILKEYADWLKAQQEAERERRETQEALDDLSRAVYERLIRSGQERSQRLMDSAQAFQAGLPNTGGLASVGGFTAGAAISAATVGAQQLRVLHIIADNTSVLARVAEAERALDALGD
jgi:hypothetical protein